MLNQRESNLFTVAEFGRRTASLISDLAVTANYRDKLNYHSIALRIKLCNSQNNLWSVRGCTDAANRSYTATGHLFECKHFACPHCSARVAATHRKQLRAILHNLRLQRGRYLKFITLTIPNRGLSLIETRTIVNDAWRLMTKRRWFRETFDGGSKSEEFTVTGRGVHYHLHLLTVSRYIVYDLLRSTWTSCVLKAFERRGHTVPSVATADGMLQCKVLPVTSLRSAIAEVCKYLTKSDSWRKMPVETLGSALALRRLPRMFELFGIFRTLGSKAQPPDDEACPAEQSILDTTPSNAADVARAKSESLPNAVAFIYSVVTVARDRRLRWLEWKYGHRRLRTFGDSNHRPSVDPALYREKHAAIASAEALALSESDALMRYLHHQDVLSCSPRFPSGEATAAYERSARPRQPI